MDSQLSLSSKSTVTLNSGRLMPVLGFGVGMSTNPLEAIRIALEVGYRHIDSARLYRNEAEVGEVVRSSGIDRESLFLTTKVMNYDHGYEMCKAAIADSVSSPKPGYWDLILLHVPTSGPKKRIEAYRALVEAKEQGLAKSIGVSNFGIPHLRELESVKVGPLPAVNQLEVHPWCQQKEIVEYCRSKGIIVQAYCPVVRGKYMSHPTLVKIARKVNRTGAQVLIRWSLQHGFVPLPKSDTPHRIEENFKVFDFELDSQSMEELDQLDLGDAGAISWNPIAAP